MDIPIFLAMTATEIRMAPEIPVHPAWMSCHFSPYGRGLTNLPDNLTAGAMLMLNDRVPLRGHDPVLVSQTLRDIAADLGCESILLDFQTEDRAALMPIVEKILDTAPCPVGVSSGYAGDFDCPVVLPAPEPYDPVEAILAPWAGREIWLELTTQGAQITVTAEGSRYSPLPYYVPPVNAHLEPELLCHYEIIIQEDRITFQLGRTGEDWKILLAKTAPLGVSRGIGLYQEFCTTDNGEGAASEQPLGD